MKKGFSFIVMILVLLIGFQQAIIVAHFKLNRPSITQNYCTNKETPEMGCNGLCHLKRQLNKTDQSGSASISYPKADLVITSGFEYDSSHLFFAIAMTCFADKETPYNEPTKEIFIPPPTGHPNVNECAT